ncbi:PREDICTED: SRR1-like protein [Nicrophorus vespilloides]|uniref:SRR1-like protein n=1 Tax=Nicrophorus vespilloides TaxID=110193 RepID=A0ABM1N921_NICVS|nr:PREDICTED: SRR1-like protein [Nicrophorus vespilloides]
MISRYQFALLLCLQELFNCPVHAYDPAFTENETSLLEEFKFSNIDENNEGKYSTDAKTTFFYLPHCPKQLSNNLLWANWGLSLNNCIIVANSFNKILETHMKRVLMESANYVMKISPYMVELAIINSFKYYDMFNDTSLHIFPIDKLQLVSSEFWSDKEEPKYISDVEYIVKKMQEL